ncbi:hypothetical protein WAI453_002524 [Rhynchosporium graminicola]
MCCVNPPAREIMTLELVSQTDRLKHIVQIERELLCSLTALAGLDNGSRMVLATPGILAVSAQRPRQAFKMFANSVASALCLASLTTAHFTIDYPEMRGDSFANGASQFVYPCAGVNQTAQTNRTLWPLDGGAEYPSFNISLTPSLLNQTGNGTLCIPKPVYPLDETFEVTSSSSDLIDELAGVTQSVTAGDTCFPLHLRRFVRLVTSKWDRQDHLSWPKPARQNIALGKLGDMFDHKKAIQHSLKRVCFLLRVSASSLVNGCGTSHNEGPLAFLPVGHVASRFLSMRPNAAVGRTILTLYLHLHYLQGESLKQSSSTSQTQSLSLYRTHPLSQRIPYPVNLVASKCPTKNQSAFSVERPIHILHRRLIPLQKKNRTTFMERIRKIVSLVVSRYPSMRRNAFSRSLTPQNPRQNEYENSHQHLHRR